MAQAIEMVEAMIVWEAVLYSNRDQFEAYRGDYGAYELRDQLAHHVCPVVVDDWKRNAECYIGNGGFDGCFDWDWVPQWIRKCVVVDGSHVRVRDNHSEIARTIRCPVTDDHGFPIEKINDQAESWINDQAESWRAKLINSMRRL